jgi:hypothetical protein
LKLLGVTRAPERGIIPGGKRERERERERMNQIRGTSILSVNSVKSLTLAPCMYGQIESNLN